MGKRLQPLEDYWPGQFPGSAAVDDFLVNYGNSLRNTVRSEVLSVACFWVFHVFWNKRIQHPLGVVETIWEQLRLDYALICMTRKKFVSKATLHESESG